jgi:hypothetical protein
MRTDSKPMKIITLIIAPLLTVCATQQVTAVTSDTIKKYAPIVKMHPDEEFFPSSVEYFMRYVHDENNFFTTVQSLREPSDYTLPFFRGELESKSPPVYAISVPKPSLGADVTEVHYFFFYPYNRGKNVCIGKFVKTFGVGCVGGYSTFGNHVGDWENIKITFHGETPVNLNASVHDSSNDYPLTNVADPFVSISHQETHPIVYSAKGSHGTYVKPGRMVYKTLPNDELIDDTADGGLEWRTYENVVVIPYHVKGQYPAEFSFMNFSGRWGNPKDGCGIVEKISGECILNDGPTGPAYKSAVNP